MSKENFLSTVTVLDTETTSLHANQAEIVEIAGAVYDGKTWQIKDTLLGAKNGIPPEASAKNHISSRMINGLPTFSESVDLVCNILRWPSSKYWVAHNSSYDQEVMAHAWVNSNNLSYIELAIDNSRWICTHRLAKQLLPFNFNDMQYNLNYLRYKLDLLIPDSFGSHRAAVDALTCATLFEFLINYAIETNVVTNDSTLGEQIHALCWKPFHIDKWPFGKHKGKLLSEIDTDYLIWAGNNVDCLNDKLPQFDFDLSFNFLAELEKRIG